jgi:hypothetical protein
MDCPADGLVAARDLLADGATRKDAVAALAAAIGKLKTSRIHLAPQAPAENSHEKPG